MSTLIENLRDHLQSLLTKEDRLILFSIIESFYLLGLEEDLTTPSGSTPTTLTQLEELGEKI